MTEPFWSGRPRRVPVLSLVGASREAQESPRAATILLARLASREEFAGRGPWLVPDLWAPAAAGGVLAGFGLVSWILMTCCLSLVGLPTDAAPVAALLWTAPLFVAERFLLGVARRHTARWQQLLIVVGAGNIGAAAALPTVLLTFVPAGWFADRPTPLSVLAGTAGLVAPLLTVTLAVLPVPTMSGRCQIFTRRAAGMVYVSGRVAPPARRHRPGVVSGTLLWLGAMRDDVAGRWASLDSIHGARGGLVLAVMVLGGAAAGIALDAAAPGHPALALAGGTTWALTSGALARHHFVQSDDAEARPSPFMVALSGLACALAGLVTAAFLVAGVLGRQSAPVIVPDDLSLLRALALQLDAEPRIAVAVAIIAIFALFVHLLPVLSWHAGLISTMQGLVALLDAATVQDAARRPVLTPADTGSD